MESLSGPAAPPHTTRCPAFLRLDLVIRSGCLASIAMKYICDNARHKLAGNPSAAKCSAEIQKCKDGAAMWQCIRTDHILFCVGTGSLISSCPRKAQLLGVHNARCRLGDGLKGPIHKRQHVRLVPDGVALQDGRHVSRCQGGLGEGGHSGK